MRSGMKDYRSPSQRQGTDSAQLILDLIGFVAHLCQWCQPHCNSNPLIIVPRCMPDDQREHQSDLCNWNIVLRSGLWAEGWCRPTTSYERNAGSLCLSSFEGLLTYFYHWQKRNDKNYRLKLPSSTWQSQLNVTWPPVTCSNMIWNHADHKTWGTWELFTSRFFSRSLELAQLGSSGFTRSYMQACWAW